MKSFDEQWQTQPDRALESVFRAEYANLCRTAYRLVGKHEVSEDLVQDAFMELWKRRESLDFHISVNAYLRRAVTNRSLNYLRDNRRLVPMPDNPAAFGGSTNSNPAEISELRELIVKTIDGLPEKCREAFILSRYEAFSYKEIAEQLNISVKTVEKHIAKGLLTLRNVLHAENFLIK